MPRRGRQHTRHGEEARVARGGCRSYREQLFPSLLVLLLARLLALSVYFASNPLRYKPARCLFFRVRVVRGVRAVHQGFAVKFVWAGADRHERNEQDRCGCTPLLRTQARKPGTPPPPPPPDPPQHAYAARCPVHAWGCVSFTSLDSRTKRGRAHARPPPPTPASRARGVHWCGANRHHPAAGAQQAWALLHRGRGAHGRPQARGKGEARFHQRKRVGAG